MKKIMFNDRFGLTGAVLEGRKTVTRRIVPYDRESSPAYKVGEIVSISQKYKDIINYDFYNEKEIDSISKSAGWNNKMFVLSNLMPYKIEILNVRVERLQDITDEDCIKEGISSYDLSGKNYTQTIYGIDKGIAFIELGKTPSQAFASLIDKVSGKGTWGSNPYVFRYEFKLK